MNQKISKLLAAVIGEKEITLRTLALRYSEGCWHAWRSGKAGDLDNSDNPFCGSPEMMLANGITKLEGVDGDMIFITPMTRIRLRQLSDASLGQLDILNLKDGSNPGADVIHPEFTETFKELIAKSEQFLMNNFLAASAVLDTIFSFLVTDDMNVEDLVAVLQGALDGSNSFAAGRISLGVRMSWIGRACIDGSWHDSKDYIFFCNLTADVAGIDAYVARPVIIQLINDLNAA